MITDMLSILRELASDLPKASFLLKVMLTLAMILLGLTMVAALWSVPGFCPPIVIVTSLPIPIVTSLPIPPVTDVFETAIPCPCEVRLVGVPSQVVGPRVSATIRVQSQRTWPPGGIVVLAVTYNDETKQYIIGQGITIASPHSSQDLDLDSGGTVSTNGVQVRIHLLVMDAETLRGAADLRRAIDAHTPQTAQDLRQLLGNVTYALCGKVEFTRNRS